MKLGGAFPTRPSRYSGPGGSAIGLRSRGPCISMHAGGRSVSWTGGVGRSVSVRSGLDGAVEKDGFFPASVRDRRGRRLDGTDNDSFESKGRIRSFNETCNPFGTGVTSLDFDVPPLDLPNDDLVADAPDHGGSVCRIRFCADGEHLGASGLDLYQHKEFGFRFEGLPEHAPNCLDYSRSSQEGLIRIDSPCCEDDGDPWFVSYLPTSMCAQGFFHEALFNQPVQVILRSSRCCNPYSGGDVFQTWSCNHGAPELFQVRQCRPFSIRNRKVCDFFHMLNSLNYPSCNPKKFSDIISSPSGLVRLGGGLPALLYTRSGIS